MKALDLISELILGYEQALLHLQAEGFEYNEDFELLIRAKQFVVDYSESPDSMEGMENSNDYITKDISDEQFRVVTFLQTGRTYQINEPKTLIIRKGGSTHRVVDSQGLAHCYVAPESGLTVITWKSKTDTPVQF